MGNLPQREPLKKKVYTKTVVENGSYDAKFEVSVKYDNARNVTYKADPNKLEPELVEPDYTHLMLHNETSEQWEERQTEIRCNFHKKRVSEDWEQYETRTGLPAPVFIDEDQRDIWANKVAAIVRGESTVNEAKQKAATQAECSEGNSENVHSRIVQSIRKGLLDELKQLPGETQIAWHHRLHQTIIP